MRKFVRQWAEQVVELDPKKRRYDSAQILEWSGAMLAVSIRLPWELEEELSRKALYFPPPVAGVAVIDTGATSTGFDRSVIAKLKLLPTDVEKATTAATGRRIVNQTYLIRLTFPGTQLPDFQIANATPHRLSVAPLPIPEELRGKVVAILGRDFLRFYTFTWDGPTGTFTLATTRGDAPGSDP